jgi:hypothetical protein
MKLELKHLAPYLPYGLRGFYMDADYDKQIEVEGLYNYDDIYNSEHGDMSFDYFKPILRQLSDLTKEIEVNGEKFVPIIKLAFTKSLSMYQFIDGAFYCNNYGKFLEIKEMPYIVIEKLFEWHFDVFGLIEKGLAIDINTLN